MLRRPLVALLALALSALGLSTVRAEGEAAATITGGELREHITFLASDDLRGRDTGSAGERAAGEYLAAAFARYGLEPLGEDGSYFLPFPVAGEATIERSAVRIDRGDFYRDFEAGRDYQPFGFSGSGELDVPIVFAGYGVTDPSRGYDDYAGLDVTGKAVLILRHEPREKDAQASAHAHFTTKAINARNHGAVALLVVTDPLNHAGDEALVPFGVGGSDDLGIVALHVRQSLAKGLVRLAGKDLTEVQRAIDAGLAPDSFDLGARLRVGIEIQRATITARNVIGRLPGSDPALRDEVVVIGAHYDHVGLGGHGGLDPGAEGQIHNGADDNASGTSGMLEIAQAFAGGARPRRTILFMGFSGEERGLLGSEHFVKHPAVPLANIVAMINLDMIGRLRDGSLEVGGVGTSPGFRELVEAATGAAGLKAALDPSGFGPSDHASFYAAKVPVLFFFTGLHDDYHRPGDDTPKIEFDGAARVARAAFLCAERIANADARPAYVEVAPERGGRGDRPRLGVQLDQARVAGGAGVTRVVEGSPAANAGIQAGDIIVKLCDTDVDTARDLVEALGGRQFDEKVPVVVLRGTERLTLEVTLTRP